MTAYIYSNTVKMTKSMNITLFYEWIELLGKCKYSKNQFYSEFYES